ncbi:hypothetical protein MKY16_19255 [Paenibacillus sp. FSL L8-0641]|uniref:hypothetical protein n=1 Tax=Paenibacillus sp. FSL L8-0641 TaxID=2921605 RepID=UPI0030F5594E
MAACYCCICLPTTMVIDDFILPITHGLRGTLNGYMIHVLALLKPTVKTLGGDLNIR